MEWLNYHHLHYFWVVAKEGSIAGASKRLRLAQPTISEQIRQLEESLGEPLFQREGRALVLTEVGRVVQGYADEIFSLGRQLQDVVRGRSGSGGAVLSVGIADVVPKPVAFQLLAPARRLSHPVRLVCHEGKPERLMAELAEHALDLVLSDAPIASVGPRRSFAHLLGESPIAIFAEQSLAARYVEGFPTSLQGAPLLVPHNGAALRRSIDAWFHERGIAPDVVGEFEDSALMQVFAESGEGLFAAPAAISSEMARQHALVRIGLLEPLRERYYALTVERRIKHPAAQAICDAARQVLFRDA